MAGVTGVKIAAVFIGGVVGSKTTLSVTLKKLSSQFLEKKMAKKRNNFFFTELIKKTYVTFEAHKQVQNFEK